MNTAHTLARSPSKRFQSILLVVFFFKVNSVCAIVFFYFVDESRSYNRECVSIAVLIFLKLQATAMFRSSSKKMCLFCVVISLCLFWCSQFAYIQWVKCSLTERQIRRERQKKLHTHIHFFVDTVQCCLENFTQFTHAAQEEWQRNDKKIETLISH